VVAVVSDNDLLINVTALLDEAILLFSSDFEITIIMWLASEGVI
jgi:hypothetical protein